MTLDMIGKLWYNIYQPDGKYINRAITKTKTHRRRFMNTKTRIMLCIEEVSEREHISSLLRSVGFVNLYEADNHRQAAEMLEAGRCDMIICDTAFDGGEGIQLIFNDKEHSERLRTKPIHFIIFGSLEQAPLLEELGKLENVATLTSPYTSNEFWQRIFVGSAKAMGEFKPEQKPKAPDKPLEIRISDALHMIGIPAHIKGYTYLRSAITMTVNDPDIINFVTKSLYPSVAKEFSTSTSRVERAIRHAIEVAWDRGDVDTLNSLFGYTISRQRGKPTNSEFIALISDKLRLNII